MTAPRLAGVNVHPVKSTAIRPLEQAYVGRFGIVGDREWMVVDNEAGKLVTARELPGLFTIVADCQQDCEQSSPRTTGLRLTAPGVEPLDVAVPGPAAATREVRVHSGPPMPARLAGDDADEWLSEVLGRDVRLVWCADPSQRVLKAELGAEHAAFQDDSAVTLLSTASVAQVSTWAQKPIESRRFRPNLVVAGADQPFAEDDWREIAIGEARLRVVSRVDRCVMTTIDPDTLERGKDPLRTLARHRRWDGRTWLAVHLAVVRPGTVTLGDEVILG